MRWRSWWLVAGLTLVLGACGGEAAAPSTTVAVTTSEEPTTTTLDTVPGTVDTVVRLGLDWEPGWDRGVVNGELLPLATVGNPAPLTASTPEGILAQIMGAWNAMYEDWDTDGSGTYDPTVDACIPASQYIAALGYQGSADFLSQFDAAIRPWRGLHTSKVEKISISADHIVEHDFPDTGNLAGMTVSLSGDDYVMFLDGYVRDYSTPAVNWTFSIRYDQAGRPSLDDWHVDSQGIPTAIIDDLGA